MQRKELERSAAVSQKQLELENENFVIMDFSAFETQILRVTKLFIRWMDER